MPMTLRLSDAAAAALDRIVVSEHLPSKVAAIEAAIIEKDSRSSQVDRARAHVDMIAERDADLLARLARR